MPVARIDLNSDVGEGFGVWPGGPDDELLTIVSSANIACGAHAGDPSSMRSTCAAAARLGVTIGAQVGYADLVGFGRRFIDMTAVELTDLVIHQLGALDAFAHVVGSSVRYVKPHGALYNAIVHHAAQAGAVALAIDLHRPTLAVLGLPGSAIERAAGERGLRFVAEGFADRAYASDGTLVPRTTPGAVLTSPVAAAEQALRLAEAGVESICVHSDTPGAVAIATAVRDAFRGRGIATGSFVAESP